VEVTDEQWSDILNYVTAAREFLRMQNWNVWVMMERLDHMDDDCFATTGQSNNHDSLQIWINHDAWGDMDDTERADTIIHELLHAQHRDVSTLWDSCTQNNSAIPTDEALAWNADFRMFMERVVSNWTRSLLPFAPQWPGPKRVGVGVRLRPA
jgi:hypothetical protein